MAKKVFEHKPPERSKTKRGERSPSPKAVKAERKKRSAAKKPLGEPTITFTVTDEHGLKSGDKVRLGGPWALDGDDLFYVRPTGDIKGYEDRLIRKESALMFVPDGKGGLEGVPRSKFLDPAWGSPASDPIGDIKTAADEYFRVFGKDPTYFDIGDPLDLKPYTYEFKPYESDGTKTPPTWMPIIFAPPEGVSLDGHDWYISAYGEYDDMLELMNLEHALINMIGVL